MDGMIYDMSNIRRAREAYLRRSAALKSERSSWLPHWSDISRHVRPRSARFTISDRNRTDRSRYNKILDNTATVALRVLEAGMMAGATSPARPWFRLTTPDPSIGEIYSVRVWLDDVVARMQRVFAKSNVYRALHNAYGDLGAYGTTCIVVLPDFENIIHCYSLTCGEYCLQQDYKGHITSVYREFQKTVGETVKEFGYENCSRAVQDAFKTGELENPVDILHVIEPRSDRERNPESKLAKDMPWRSLWLEIGGDEDRVLLESGFERFPVLAPRWQVDGGDVYGTSPAMDALGDIRQLQHEQLMKGTGIAYKAKPPLQVPTSLKDRDIEGFPGGVSYFEPGSILPFDQVTPGGGIRTAFEVNLDLDPLLMDIQDVRVRIKRAFYEDLFLMLATAGPNTRMTATEVAERHEEKLLMLGPVLERLHNELLSPLIELTFDEMLRVGMIPPPPPELYGVDLSVEFVSILAQAQRAIGTNSIDRFMGNVMQLSQVKPEILDKVNFDAYVDHYGRLLGVDSKLIVEDAVAQELRAARGRAQAAAEAVQIQREQAAATKDLAASPTTGQTALTDALSAITGSNVPAEMMPL